MLTAGFGVAPNFAAYSPVGPRTAALPRAAPHPSVFCCCAPEGPAEAGAPSRAVSGFEPHRSSGQPIRTNRASGVALSDNPASQYRGAPEAGALRGAAEPGRLKWLISVERSSGVF